MKIREKAKAFLFVLLLTGIFSSCKEVESFKDSLQEPFESEEEAPRELLPPTIENILDNYKDLGKQRSLNYKYDLSCMSLDRPNHLFNGEETYKEIAGSTLPKDALVLDMISETDRMCHDLELRKEKDYYILLKEGKNPKKEDPNVSMYGYYFSTRQLYLDKAWNNPVRELVSFCWCTHEKDLESLYPVTEAVYEGIREKYGISDSAMEAALKSSSAFLEFVGSLDSYKVLATMNGNGFEGEIRFTIHPPYMPSFPQGEPMPYLTVVWQREPLTITGSPGASYFRGNPEIESKKLDDPENESYFVQTVELKNFALDY